jgi:diguanylate cyclase (GGDEF)-like protein/PAS domain S-box-containing protein
MINSDDTRSEQFAPAAPRGVFRVVLVYAGFGALWILLSDHALELLFRNQQQFAWASTIKGWAFIGVTSLLLYGLVRRLVGQNIAASERIRQMQAQKLEALRLLDAIGESSTDAIYAKDLNSRYLFCNREAARLIGRVPEQVVGHFDQEWFTAEQAAQAVENDRKIMAERKVSSFQESFNTILGEIHCLSTKGPLYDDAGQVVGMFGVSRDITEQLRTEKILRERELSFRRLTEQVPAIIYRATISANSQTIYISPRVETLGYSVEEWLSDPKLWEQLLHPDDLPTVLQQLAESHREGTPFSSEYRLLAKNGEWRHFSDEAQVIYDEQGQALYLQGIMLDITERKESEESFHRLAYYDALTGLPNRMLFMDRVGQMMTLSRREKRYCALILLNLDRLKTLNDALGRAAGDMLLKTVADRLTSILREDDTMARMSGDEFAVLLQGRESEAHIANRHAHVVADKIHQVLRQPFNTGRDEVIVTATLGITLFPEMEHDAADDILRRADTALHLAKKSGGNQTAFFETDMEQLASQRFQVERELRHAIKAGELRLYFQSQVDARGQEVGVEALVRWQHPLRGLVLPGAFVPIAEESDLIIDLDNWVLKAVCDLQVHPAIAESSIRVSINISPRHFRHPSFVDSVRNLIAHTGADPSSLTFEVTEGLMIENMSEVVARMTELAALGIHFSMDDFGTGYSSLAYLKRMPIHELKIDKTFVQDAPDDPDDAALVEVILSVARHLKLKIVAEGVETQAQADFLNSRAKVIHQGYLFSRPEPAEAWLARRAAAVNNDSQDERRMS